MATPASPLGGVRFVSCAPVKGSTIHRSPEFCGILVTGRTCDTNIDTSERLNGRTCRSLFKGLGNNLCTGAEAVLPPLPTIWSSAIRRTESTGSKRVSGAVAVELKYWSSVVGYCWSEEIATR